jgi:hypothetical protein
MTVRVLSLLTHAANMVVFDFLWCCVVMVGFEQLKTIQYILSYLAELLVLQYSRQMKKNAKRE